MSLRKVCLDFLTISIPNKKKQKYTHKHTHTHSPLQEPGTLNITSHRSWHIKLCCISSSFPAFVFSSYSIWNYSVITLLLKSLKDFPVLSLLTRHNWAASPVQWDLNLSSNINSDPPFSPHFLLLCWYFLIYRLLQRLWWQVWRWDGQGGQKCHGFRVSGQNGEARVTKRSEALFYLYFFNSILKNIGYFFLFPCSCFK